MTFEEIKEQVKKCLEKPIVINPLYLPMFDPGRVEKSVCPNCKSEFIMYKLQHIVGQRICNPCLGSIASALKIKES